jgi:hypothetical protein
LSSLISRSIVFEIIHRRRTVPRLSASPCK